MAKLLAFVLAAAVLALVSCAAPVPEIPREDVPPVPDGIESPDIEEAAGPSPTPDDGKEPEPLPEEVAALPFEEIPFAYPFIGSEDAKITIAYYGDFADPLNSRVHFATVPALKRDFVISGKARLVFRPLSGEKGMLAAEASLCSWEQGSQQFWGYHDVLFRFFTRLERENLLNYADRVAGLDKAALAECLDSGKYSNIVKASTDAARAKGIDEVPAFAVGSQLVSGDIRYGDLKAAVEEELGSSTKVTGSIVAAPLEWNVPEFLAWLFE